jgi:hypothetical protein
VTQTSQSAIAYQPPGHITSTQSLEAILDLVKGDLGDSGRQLAGREVLIDTCDIVPGAAVRTDQADLADDEGLGARIGACRPQGVRHIVRDSYERLCRLRS